MPSEIVPHSTYTIRQNRTKIAAGPLEYRDALLGSQGHRHGQSTVEPLPSRRPVRVTKPKGGLATQDLRKDFDGSSVSSLPSLHTYTYCAGFLVDMSDTVNQGSNVPFETAHLAPSTHPRPIGPAVTATVGGLLIPLIWLVLTTDVGSSRVIEELPLLSFETGVPTGMYPPHCLRLLRTMTVVL